MCPQGCVAQHGLPRGMAKLQLAMAYSHVMPDGPADGHPVGCRLNVLPAGLCSACNPACWTQLLERRSITCRAGRVDPKDAAATGSQEGT